MMRVYGKRHPVGFGILVGLFVSLPGAGVAFAQTQVDSPQGGGGAPSGGGGGGNQVAPAAPTPAPAPAAPAAPSVPLYPGAVAPPLPGQPVGGGNATESSSRPVTGDKEDTFDLGPKGGGSGSMYGNANGPVYLGGGGGGSESQSIGSGGGVSGGTIPFAHSVRKGDTLWAICDQYFHNPYQWPRIWSYNPQLQNPHWIYPGDQVKLRSGGAPPPVTNGTGMTVTEGQGSFIDRRRQVGPETIFLRDEGYAEGDAKDNWGEISGAPEDKMFLSDFDEVYLRIVDDHDIKLGQELTIYRPTRAVGTGRIVQIQGTVRIDQWNAKEGIARAQVVESLDVIERGARVGPIGRRFEVISPVRNDVDLKAQVIASVQPHNFYGQNQVVFLDRGQLDGLKPGNRLFIIRKGDAWHQSLPSSGAANRIALESQSPAQVEKVPRPREESRYPEEVVGELRVLGVKPHSSTCMVTQSTREIEMNDIAVARKGY